MLDLTGRSQDWEFLGSHQLRGKGSIPFSFGASIIRVKCTGRTPPSWFRAGVIVREIMGFDFNKGRVERRSIVLLEENIIIWEHDLNHTYSLSFYPMPWLRATTLTFFFYQLFLPEPVPSGLGNAPSANMAGSNFPLLP